MLTYRELLRAVFERLSKRRWLFPVPFPLWWLLALMASPLPYPPITRDQLELLRRDNVATGDRTFEDPGLNSDCLSHMLDSTRSRKYAAMTRRKPDIRIKRVSDKPHENDGRRVLVDRLWPRGLSKDKARVDDWMKGITLSDELRKWFGHRSERWDEFRSRYLDELDRHRRAGDTAGAVQAGNGDPTVRREEQEQNNAVVQKVLYELEAN